MINHASVQRKSAIARQSKIFDLRIPITLIVAILLQAAGAVWWAASKNEEGKMQNSRLGNLESSFTKIQDVQISILERLARIEERNTQNLHLLNQIDQKLEGNHK